MSESVTINTRPAGAGWTWIQDGFGIFKQAPGLWIGVILGMAVLHLLMSMVPILGTLASSVLGPVLSAGLIYGCYDLERGRELKFLHIFEGFNRGRTGPLMMVGVLTIVLGIGLALLIGIVMAIGMGGSGMHDPEAMMDGMNPMLSMGFLAVVLILVIPFVMLLLFANQLVALHELDAWLAMKASYSACMKNIGALTVYGLALIPLALVAAIPFGLGLLVLAPTIIAANYCAYREIFPRPELGAEPEKSGEPPIIS